MRRFPWPLPVQVFVALAAALLLLAAYGCLSGSWEVSQ